MGVIFASAKDGKNVCSACYFCPTPVTPSWPGLRTFMAIATFMTTTARIYVQTYAIYRLLSEITDDHLHVLLKYYYNVYLSYS